MYTKISQIRAERSKDKTLLLNTGDTIQGSVEALFTKRQALVDVLNRFAIDAYAPAGRLKLIEPMPITSFGSPEIQPWRGAVTETTSDVTGTVERPGSNSQRPK